MFSRFGRASDITAAPATFAALQLRWSKGMERRLHSTSELRRLPGVGDYTAAAVASFAFDAVEPVIDANIARLLARLRNWKKPIDDASGSRVPDKMRPGSFCQKSGGRLHNSALMDLGALICVARNPRCCQCPIRQECAAEKPGKLPIKKAAPIRGTRFRSTCVRFRERKAVA